MKAQALAVDRGDPASIATASRSLNAELYLLLAQVQISRGKPDEAIGLFQQSVNQQSSSERRLEFASVLLRSGNFAAALNEADAVLAIEPGNAAAWMIRGSALKEGGRDREAVVALTRALQLGPAPNVAFTLGSTYLSLHEKDEAADIFKRLIAASGKAPIWYVAVGDAYRDAGYLDDAVTNFQQALALDPRVLHGEFFLGLTFLQLNQWGPNSESFQHLRKAVSLNPHEYFSNFYLGALESTDGSDMAASDAHLQAAAAADPTQPEVWLYLGLNANRERRLPEAKTFLRKAIELTGKDEARNNYQVRRAYFALGRLLVAEGQRTEGEALLAKYKLAERQSVGESRTAIAEMGEHTAGQPSDGQLPALPTSTSEKLASEQVELPVQNQAEATLKALLASSLNDLGTAEARQHEYAAAMQDFQRSAQWDDAKPLVYRNLGTAAFRVHDNAEATRALRLYQQKQVAAGQPVDPHAQLLLALSEFALGDFAGATANFGGPAESLTLQDATTAYSYAFALARTGHAQEANHVAEALVSKPLPTELLPLVCHIFIDTENYNGSQTCYRKALEVEPNLTLAHYEIGESLIRLDRPGDAIPELRKELLLTPDNPNVRSALAFALLQTSQKDEARTLLQGTTAAHPEHAEAQYEYGKLLLEEGQLKESILHLEMAEEADPSKEYVHYQLGTAYKKDGRSADAERELKLYRQLKDTRRNENAVPH